MHSITFCLHDRLPTMEGLVTTLSGIISPSKYIFKRFKTELFPGRFPLRQKPSFRKLPSAWFPLPGWVRRSPWARANFFWRLVSVSVLRCQVLFQSHWTRQIHACSLLLNISSMGPAKAKGFGCGGGSSLQKHCGASILEQGGVSIPAPLGWVSPANRSQRQRSISSIWQTWDESVKDIIFSPSRVMHRPWVQLPSLHTTPGLRSGNGSLDGLG